MKRVGHGPSKVRTPLLVLSAVVFLAGAAGVFATIVSTDLQFVANIEPPLGGGLLDVTQADLLAAADRFENAFEIGNETFQTNFLATDGIGANVGGGERFTRMPRADRQGTNPVEWANHTPSRATGPNAQACTGCHNEVGFGNSGDDGAGRIEDNVHRDPGHTGTATRMIQRNTPHLFAAGAVQKLAEEMTTDLFADRAAAVASACAGGSGTRDLITAKEVPVNFGKITAIRPASGPCNANTVTFNTSAVVGVDPDLVVRPFQWKGSVAFIRDFNRGAFHNEIGLQAVEITGDNVDGDGDGVTNEQSIGSETAMALYVGGQPRPTTKQELASLGLIPALSNAENAAIGRGSQVFSAIGCSSCHIRQVDIGRTFSEPSQLAAFRDATFPAGQNPVAAGVDPANAITFDLTEDQPDNIIRDANGNIIRRLGSLFKDFGNLADITNFGDLKRHDMGPGLAEQIDETGSGASVFLTENLWGVGSTAPYLHDGRATTLTGAILLHGGEAQASRNAFAGLSTGSQKDLVAFLNNLVLFKQEDEE